MSLSRFRAQPRKGHLHRAKRIVGYILFLPDSAIRFRTGEPDFSSLKDQEYDRTRMIEFPPKMDENWVRYVLVNLGQILCDQTGRELLSCAYTTQLLYSTVEVCWNNNDSYFIWFKFVCRKLGQIASRRSWKRSCLGVGVYLQKLTVGSFVGAQLG